MEKFLTVHGIGERRARLLYDAGARTLADLRRPEFDKLLTTEIRLFLRNKVTSRIPREAVMRLAPRLQAPFVEVAIAGSYRRGKKVVRDIDVIITPLSRRGSISGVLARYMTWLTTRMQVIPYARGEVRASAIVRDVSIGCVKIDIFLCPRNELPFMILYSTGSGKFNIIMRRIAKSHGYLLNQHGLFDNTGKKIPARNEREIFSRLRMAYVPPDER